MKKYILLLCLIIISLLCAAQKQGNIWYFGANAGLNFSHDTVVADTNGRTYYDTINYPACYSSPPDTVCPTCIDSAAPIPCSNMPSEGTGILCDSAGNLLCYSDGRNIWNRNNIVMQNGDNLTGNPSTTQAAIIIPQPNSNRHIYVFTPDAFQDSLSNGFRYSVIDMCGDSGMGAVTNKKNILLMDTVAEKVTAIRHSNGVDYWIITHKYFSDAFCSFLLTDSGIVDTVISHVGSVHTNACGVINKNVVDTDASSIGSLKASPDGSKLVCLDGQGCNHISELFTFNADSGTVSNCVKLYTDTIAMLLYGASFSPNSSKLYISSVGGHNRVYQYDLSSGIADTMLNSKTVIADLGIKHEGAYDGMSLANNGRVYIARQGMSYISSIQYPDSAGIACGFIDTSISLNGRICSMGLPNFVDCFNYSNGLTECSVSGIENNNSYSIAVYPNPFHSQIIVGLPSGLQAQMTINDVCGKIVYNGAVKTSEPIELNISSGIYFYQINTITEILGVGKLICQ